MKDVMRDDLRADVERQARRLLDHDREDGLVWSILTAWALRVERAELERDEALRQVAEERYNFQTWG